MMAGISTAVSFMAEIKGFTKLKTVKLNSCIRNRIHITPNLIEYFSSQCLKIFTNL